MKKRILILALIAIGAISFSVAMARNCGNGVCGDVNGDGDVNILDCSLCIKFVYCYQWGIEFCESLEPEVCEDNLDVNCDGKQNPDDCQYLIDYLYYNGPDPCDPDDDGDPDC